MGANDVSYVNLKFEKYLTTCFSYADNKSKDIPACIVTTNERIPIVKLIKWECIRKSPLHSMKLFYIYCIILLSDQDNLSDFKNVFRKIFVITYSKFQTQPIVISSMISRPKSIAVKLM